VLERSKFKWHGLGRGWSEGEGGRATLGGDGAGEGEGVQSWEVMARMRVRACNPGR
jgi:hypothetical protein